MTYEINELLRAIKAARQEQENLQRQLANIDEHRRRRREEKLRIRREELRKRENYREDYAKAEGMFERYIAGDEEERQIIVQSAWDLRPDKETPHPNYAFLPTEARLVTLGSFLRLQSEPHAYPGLVFNADNFRRNEYVFRHFAGACSLADWRARAQDIADYLNATSHNPWEWRITKLDPVHILLSAHPPLPAQLTVDKSQMVTGQLLLGVDVDTREPCALPFADLTHTLVAGQTGSGKSNAAHLLVRGILGNLSRVHKVVLVDLKQGITFRRYGRLGIEKVEVLTTLAQFTERLEALRAEIDARNAAVAEAELDHATDFVFLIIDELPSVVRKPVTDDKEEKREHARLIANLHYLADQGRSAGLRIIATTQHVNEDAVPVNLRGAFGTIIGFRLKITAQAATLFDGGLADLPARLSALPTGRAIVAIGDTSRLVQFPLIKPGPIDLADYSALPPPAKPMLMAPATNGIDLVGDAAGWITGADMDERYAQPRDD